MIDAHDALRDYLIEASPLRTLLGGDYVFVPDIPGGGDPPMPGKAIAFRFNGGFTFPTIRAQDARVSFRCYGATTQGAGAVYRALYDRLHDKQNFVVGDVGFHGTSEQVPGVPLEDPTTHWPYFFAVYSVRVATIPVTGGAGGS